MYLQLKGWGTDSHGSVPLETRRYDRENLLSDGHLEWVVVPCPLQQHTHIVNIYKCMYGHYHN